MLILKRKKKKVLEVFCVGLNFLQECIKSEYCITVLTHLEQKLKGIKSWPAFY